MLPWILGMLINAAHAGIPDEAPSAEAPSPSALAEDAAALLSRQPAGSMPATAPILAAIAALEEHGTGEHLSLLRSLETHEEDPGVRDAASRAIHAVSQRNRAVLREEFPVPGRQDVQGWLQRRAEPLRRADGSLMGSREQEAVAYAALVLGDPGALPADDGEGDPARLILRGQDREDVADTRGAIALYARAAVAGGDQAMALIEEFGVDAERLLLGMSTPASEPVTAALPPDALDVLVQSGAEQTVAVLVERARGSSEMERVIALDALARMMRSEKLSPAARANARRQLEEAARAAAGDPVRSFARSALVDVDW